MKYLILLLLCVGCTKTEYAPAPISFDKRTIQLKVGDRVTFKNKNVARYEEATFISSYGTVNTDQSTWYKGVVDLIGDDNEVLVQWDSGYRDSYPLHSLKRLNKRK